MSGQIFISYRRDDASAWAGRLYDHLNTRFASNQIFMDVDTIQPGVDFVKAIEDSVGSCDLLIAVIGRRWVISSDEEGRRRFDNAEDFVRLEIATALMRGIRVIPVLVDGASMPPSGELPDDLKSLVRRNPIEISHPRFRTDSERLIVAVEQALEETTAKRLEREAKKRLEVEGSMVQDLRLPPPDRVAPTLPVTPSTSPGKRKLRPAARIMTLLALVIGLAVGAAIYFGSPRPSLKPATTIVPNLVGKPFIDAVDSIETSKLSVGKLKKKFLGLQELSSTNAATINNWIEKRAMTAEQAAMVTAQSPKAKDVVPVNTAVELEILQTIHPSGYSIRAD